MTPTTRRGALLSMGAMGTMGTLGTMGAMAAMACTRNRASLLIYAAASTTDALGEVARNFGNSPRLSFGSSGDLARQIEAGAPADLFLSADVARVDRLEKAGLVRSRRDLLKNRLVVITPHASTIANAKELASVKRLAIGDPSTVPAGAYAREWLERASLWGAIPVVPTLDVRAALAAVETGAAEAAIVYRTDVSSRVRVAFEPAEQPKIVYPLAILKAAKPEAESFAAFAAKEGRAVFDRYGFT